MSRRAGDVAVSICKDLLLSLLFLGPLGRGIFYANGSGQGGPKMLLMLSGVAVVMIVAHELAHVVATLAFGGRFDGVVVKHVLAVGVKIQVDGLSAQQIAWTLIAAPIAEVLVVAVAFAIRPQAWALWLLLLGLQWAMNFTPWPWFSTDGRKLLRLMQHGRAALTRG